MSAVRSSSARIQPARFQAELVHVGSLALIDALWLQPWLAGPAWPSGGIILGLAAVRLLTWWIGHEVSGDAGGHRLSVAGGLAAIAVFTIPRIPAGPWAAILALAGASLMAFRGAASISDRPDPSTTFRGISIAFALTSLALYVHRTSQVTAVAVITGLLIASGAALTASRWLEMSDRRAASGLPIARASGQLITATLALVAGMLVVLTPRVLSAVVLRPLGWLADRVGLLVAWLMMPVARLVEAILLRLQARANPQVIQLLNQLAPVDDGSEQSTISRAAAANVGRYVAFVVFVVLAVVVYRALSATLARRRAQLLAADGTVTVTQLTPAATTRRARPAAPRRAPEVLDGSPSGQLRAIYRKLLHDAAGSGVGRGASETPSAYAARLAAAGGAPEDVSALTDAYEDVRYGGHAPAPAVIGSVRAAAERIATAITAAVHDK